LQNEVIKPTVEGVLSIMRACKEAGTVRRVVFTSTAGAVNVEERQKPVYDENNWSDVDFCRRVKMTGWVRCFPCSALLNCELHRPWRDRALTACFLRLL